MVECGLRYNSKLMTRLKLGNRSQVERFIDERLVYMLSVALDEELKRIVVSFCDFSRKRMSFLLGESQEGGVETDYRVALKTLMGDPGFKGKIDRLPREIAPRAIKGCIGAIDKLVEDLRVAVAEFRENLAFQSADTGEFRHASTSDETDSHPDLNNGVNPSTGRQRPTSESDLRLLKEEGPDEVVSFSGQDHASTLLH